MLELTFWKVSPEGKAFTFMGVPPVAVAVAGVAVAGAVVVIISGKSSGKNPEKSSPRREGGFLLRLLMQKGAQVGVIGVPINTSPT